MPFICAPPFNHHEQTLFTLMLELGEKQQGSVPEEVEFFNPVVNGFSKGSKQLSDIYYTVK